MNKNAIRKFATEARRELISRVSQRALKYGISDKEVGNPNDDSVNGHLLSSTEKKQRAALIAQIKEKGYEQVMEEVAYTWFNRFSALRFMEVNGYLPTRVRVFTDENNAFKPQILTEAIHMELDGLDMEKVYAYKEVNDDDELYKYLLITQCNALNSVLPGMFQKIADYTELLFPDNLLREGSVVQQMIELIPEEDWKDAVQIIGWLYQYYNSEKKDEVFTALNKNVKITKENIPAVTQLFTPDWIVRYMVENSLGRLWVEGHPNDELKSQWKYYLEEAEQEPDVQAQLATIREEYKALKPEDILCIDPCSGSGHILAYMFDVLVQIYEAYGVDTRTAVASIVENNIYGLDIDDRAAQLAYFAVMMKACQYDKRFLRRKVQPHVYAIVESNHVDPNVVDYFCNGDAKLKEAMDTIISELHDAKEYGSILTVTPQDWSSLYDRFAEITEDINMSREAALRELLPLVQVAEALAQKYDAVVTNPPYMGGSGMQAKLTDYLNKYYSIAKADLFSAFIMKAGKICQTNGRIGLLTPYVWMFIASYSDLREFLVKSKQIETMTQLEYNAFPEACVPVCTFTMRNTLVPKQKGEFIKLSEFKGVDIQETKTLEAVMNRDCGYRYSICPQEFVKIPGTSIAYWLRPEAINVFEDGSPLSENAAVITKGIFTGDNNRFLRLWFEVDYKDIGVAKWNLYCKGGAFRRWYGNIDYVVLWENDEGSLRNYPKSGLGASKYFGKESFVWSKITNSLMSFRVNPTNVYFDDASPAVVFESELNYYLLGLMNSKPIQYYLDLLSPTMNNQIGDIRKVPVLFATENIDEIVALVKENTELAQNDYDSNELSFAFKRFPLLEVKFPTVQESIEACKKKRNGMRLRMKENEERINEILINVYGLEGEVTPTVDDEYVSINDFSENELVKQLISYAVGCMFGRYSLKQEGIVCTNSNCEISEEMYGPFLPDEDNIIPITDDEYFKDDIVGRFVEFIRVVYGEAQLEENLRYIAGRLGAKGSTPRAIIRNYFLDSFYKDHCDSYTSRGSGKRPIYWLFDSGKKGGFKCLTYIHRYKPDLLARIRTDYVHEQQARYRTAIADLETRIVNASTSERVKLNKQLKTLNDQATEIHEYEEKIHHLADQMISIDLDDGVKLNYAKFQDVLAKIK